MKILMFTIWANLMGLLYAQVGSSAVDAARLVDWSNAGLQSSALTTANNVILMSDYSN